MRPFLTPARMFLLLAGLAYATETRAADPRGGGLPDLVLQRFAVARGGDILLIPVRLAGKDRLFVVDTGSNRTVVDTSLLIGKPREIVRVTTPRGEMRLGLYDPPDASAGGISLRIDFVVGMDMERLREVSGYPIEGILGMDFLGQHVVHVDFDRGELLFLKSAPKDAEKVVPITYRPGEYPWVDLSMAGGKKVLFMIDTGGIGLISGSMKDIELKSLVRKREFLEVGSGLGWTASGTYSDRLFQGKRLFLGDFRVQGPVFSETRGRSALGLGFWSRFVVTYDFPGRKVYLNKGQDYERPDRWNHSGIFLVRKGGLVVVESVDGGSPGAMAGIRSGDVLLAIDGLGAKDASLFQFLSALCGDGRRMCLVRRGNEEHRLTLTITR
jgi:hypothetical protein